MLKSGRTRKKIELRAEGGRGAFRVAFLFIFNIFQVILCTRPYPIRIVEVRIFFFPLITRTRMRPEPIIPRISSQGPYLQSLIVGHVLNSIYALIRCLSMSMTCSFFVQTIYFRGITAYNVTLQRRKNHSRMRKKEFNP